MNRYISSKCDDGPIIPYGGFFTLSREEYAELVSYKKKCEEMEQERIREKHDLAVMKEDLARIEKRFNNILELI